LCSEQIVQKLSTKQPSLESRQLVLQEIAAEKGITVRIYEPPCDDSGRSNHNHRKTKHGDERISRTAPVDDRDEDISGDSAQRYKDVEAAAQAAFESAASAAAAAKAAMELSRGEPRGPGDRRRMQMDPEIEKQDEVLDGRRSEKIGLDRNCSSEVEIVPEDEANHGNVAVNELKQQEPAKGKPASVRTKWGF
jgi:vacuolar protein sorting-associated protein IST1